MTWRLYTGFPDDPFVKLEMSWAIPERAGSSCVQADLLAHSGIGGEISSIPGMGQNYLLYLRSSGPFPECSVFERKTLS
ncbi:MAG: hypothetical protein KA003_20440, partial [Caldilineaceae bacterium]|nr:hypothetical protein [Caldilineaceae bacterium]